MPDASRDQLLHLLERALELPAAARKIFLDSKCGGDVELEQRLLAMLAAADAAPASPSAAPIAPPAKPSTPDADEALREGPGSHIGPFKLLQLIGEGGFGAVFLAEQEQPVVRRVALKIIKLGMDTRQVVARFEQERQALAMMDHPNIARVLDAGATATGRPYFVMDLVKGDPIAEYCDKNNLPIDERLELFAQVCNAVQHAHGKGIIHRDIKPSNILVGTQDGRAVAKVIDFGIAKATSSKLTDKTLFTEHQQVIGTLQYMSPEQAEGSLDIDTRTDVYSLGVLLYELLTGSTPFDNKTIRGALFGELQRMIREVEPPKPSTRLYQSTDTLASIAAHRRTEPRRLGSLIRGELDWIVMKSLEKDRSRRYETANGLAMDVRRYLAGEAVVAAPPGASYRLRKFVRRNRGKVAAAAAVGVALLIGVVAFAWQANIAQRERDDAVLARQAEATARGKADQLAAAEGEQRQIAQSNERKAEAINQFLLDMLGSANIRELGRDAKVAQALDRAAATTEKAFKDRPEVEAAVHQILGRTYLSLGMLDEAAPQMQAAREFHRRTDGEQSLEYGRDLRDLGTWQQLKGEQAASADTFTRAIAIVAAVGSPDSELAIDLQVDYANVLVDLHREPEAEKLLRAALLLRTAKFGREAPNTQVAINSLAVLLHKQERLDEAEPLYREALELGERTLGAEHPDTITARFNLASILRSRGNLGEAEPLMRAAYASTKKVFGDMNPKTGTGALVLARLYAAQGRYKDALPLHQECVAIRIHNEGERSAAVAVAKSELAGNFRMLGEAASAVPLLRDTVDIDIAVLGAEDRETLGARLDLANTLARTDAKAEAEAMLRELLQTCPRVLGPDNPLSIIVINSYGVLLLGQERYADAEPLVKQALDAGVRVQGADHKNTIVTELNYAAVTRELGRLDEAEAIGRDAIGRVARVYGAQHPYTSGAYRSHAETLIRLGRGDEARTQLVDAIAIDKAATGAGNPTFGNAALVLARLQLDTGHLDEAEAVLADIVSAYTSSGHGEHRYVVNARIELGRCRWLQGQFAEAEPLLLDGEKALVALLPAGKRDVQRSKDYLAAFYAAWNQAAPDAARAAQAAEWQQKAAAR